MQNNEKYSPSREIARLAERRATASFVFLLSLTQSCLVGNQVHSDNSQKTEVEIVFTEAGSEKETEAPREFLEADKTADEDLIKIETLDKDEIEEGEEIYLPGSGMKTITQLIDNKEIVSMTVNGLKNTSLADEDDRPVSLKFSRSNRDKIPTDGTVLVQGIIGEINIFRDSSSVGGAPKWWTDFNEPGSSDGFNELMYQDKFGNTIIVEFFGDKDELLYSQTITIKPASSFFSFDVTENRPAGLSVDLSKLGLGEMEDLFFQFPEKIIVHKKTDLGFEYNIYIGGDDSEQGDNINQKEELESSYFDSMCEGVEQAQRAFFGDDPALQLVNYIQVLRTYEKNGYFFPYKQDTVVITDDFIKKGSQSAKKEVLLVARHETNHAIFGYLDLYNSQKMSDLFNRLQPKDWKLPFWDPNLIHSVAEKKWAEIETFIGHPVNPTEFFASFINDLLAANLEEIMRERLNIKTAQEYIVVVQGLREILVVALKEKGIIDTPIFARFDMAEKIAQEIIAGTQK